MTDDQEAWDIYINLVKNLPSETPTPSTIRALHSAGRSRSASLWTLRHFQRQLSVTIPALLESASEAKDTQLVSALISDAHAHYAHALATLSALETHLPNCQRLRARFTQRMRAVLDADVPPKFPLAVYRFFVAHLLSSEGATKPVARPPLCAQLTDLGFSRVAEDALSWAVFERMDALVASRTSPDVRAVPKLLHWVHRFASPCVVALLPEDRPALDAARWLKRLVFHLHESVCAIRTSQLLMLIDEFPRSIPALHDLRDCILSTDRKPFVASSLREQFQKALLNAGTVTDEILQQYVNMIRTLRFLDPTGVVLESVSAPIRDYLRRRPDTVRCIVSGMTGDGDLYEELQRGPIRAGAGEEGRKRDGDGDVQMSSAIPADVQVFEAEDDDCQSIDGDWNSQLRVDSDEYERWQPEAIDAPVREGKWRAGGDAIATLVAIYGTSEQIISEYRGLLADKVVSSFDVDLKREERILDLLTERFGKEAMHDCSIILKDVRDSRNAMEVARIECNHSDKRLDNFEVTVISKEFWPKLVEETEFRATEDMEWQIATFAKSFQKAKAPRTLRWQYGLGAVEVKLAFDDGREIVTMVTPMQATILSHFSERRRLGVKELMSAMNVKDEALFRRKVQGLANQGLLRVVDARNGVYETVEEGAGVDRKVYEDQIGDGVDGGEGDGDGGEESESVEMAVYQTYIMAMLQNLKQLSLVQVHNMLQRFVQTPVYDKTQAQLATFLASLVAKGKVEVVAGMYRVKK